MKRDDDSDATHARLQGQIRDLRSLAKIAVFQAFASTPEPTANDVVSAIVAALDGPISQARQTASTLATQLERAQSEARSTAASFDRYVMREYEQRAQLVADCHTSAPPEPAVTLPVHGYFVYVLWGHDGAPVYVGSSRNVLSRLGSHMTPGQKRGLVAGVTVQEFKTEAKMLEAEWGLIGLYRPPLNVNGIPADEVA